MKITAIYTRVSTVDQSLEAQLPDLERYAAALEGGFRMYSDQYTGRAMDRPGFNLLLEDARAGRVARLVVWRLDRLGRTARGLLALAEELQALGVQLVSLKEGLDLATPAGRLMFAILASVAEFETEIRAERVKAGQDAARAKGKRWGGSKKGRRWRVTAEKEAAVRQLAAGGGKIASIARTVGLSRDTVRALLRREPDP